MNHKAVRQVLEKERQRLAIELGLSSGPGTGGDRSASPFNKKLEAASQMSELEQRLMKVRRLKQQMADIEHALEKMDKGTYGVCDDCQKPIAVERLKVMPQANLCLECKAKERRTVLSSYAR